MKNKIIVITGGATGMGFAIAKALIETNTIISIDRNAAKIEDLKVSLPKINSIGADITSNEDVDNAIKAIEQSWGKLMC